jgi:hypothetical protein
MRLLSTVVLALIAAAPTAAFAAPPPSAALFAHRFVRAWQPPAGLAAAMRVAIDPETGQLGPARGDGLLPSERDARKAYEAARAAVRPVLRPDGITMVPGDLVRAYEVVRVGPDGKLVQDCVASPVDVLRLMRTPVTPTPAATEQ